MVRIHGGEQRGKMMIIDDNFLSGSEVRGFHKLVMNDHNRWWGITPLVSFNNENLRNTYKINNWSPSTSHQMVSQIDPNAPADNVGRAAAQILRTFCYRHGIKINRVTRGKMNITWNNGDSLVAPHIDGTEPHMVFLYYINDSDGDTIFYDHLWSKDSDWVDLNEEMAVSPKAGRAVLFNGSKFHTSTAPSCGNTRIVLNITFE